MTSRYKAYGKGWWEEPERHRLSAMGISTGRRTEEKTPFIMKTVLPHIPMTLGFSPGSKEFLGRRGKEQDILDTLKSRGWEIKYSDYPPPGAYEAYKGSNYMLLGVTHWDKLGIEKISLTDPNERRILHALFRKPYPYTIPDYAKNTTSRWQVKQVGSKFKVFDNDIGEFLIGYDFDSDVEANNFISSFVRKKKKRMFESQQEEDEYWDDIAEMEAVDRETKPRDYPRPEYSKIPSTEQQINKILYEPKKDIDHRKVLTIEIPRNKSHNLDFLKAYTEFNTVGVWKNYKDKNIQVEIEFKDDSNDTNTKHLLGLIQDLNRDKIKEKVIYARVEPIEKSTLSYSLAQAKLFQEQ